MRLRFIKNSIILFFAVLIVALWYIQCIKGPRYMELSRKNRIRLVSLTAPRGDIYDRNMHALATSRVAFDCAIIPQEFRIDEEKMEVLAAFLKTQSYILKKKIREDALAPFAPVVLKKDISKDTAIAISERSIDFPGLIIQTYPARYYPHGNVCSHALGYLGKISEEELNALRDYGYKVRDFVGRGGLEFFYDDYLKGEDGGMQTEVDSRGRELRVLGVREPEKGRDIATTLDIELEEYIDALMAEHRGAVIVTDPRSGEILALVSKPDFDSNIFVSSADPALINDLLKRSDYPFINRAISGTYPPGSVFKIVTATAAIEEKKAGMNKKLDCKGFYEVGSRRFHCWKETGHGLQTIQEGLKNSCNVFFYQLGRGVGVNRLAEYALRYGFGKTAGVDLPYEENGVLPSAAWKLQNRKESWYEGDTVNYAIGQGYLLVTPMQILNMVNAVATEGEVIRPFLVKKIDDVEVGAPERFRVDISNDSFEMIKEGMKKAVEDKDGTAARARVDDLEIAGKTGTAQTGTDKTHAWFSGFSPIENPKKSLVVFLEYGGKGGDKPSRIAADIFAKMKEMGYL